MLVSISLLRIGLSSQIRRKIREVKGGMK